MTKANMIAEIAKKANIPRKTADVVISTLVEIIIRSLKKGERVPLAGLGTFAVRNTKARKGRNPRTGEEIKIPAKKRPIFRPGKELRQAIQK